MSFLSEMGGHFESSSVATPQWNSFYRKACNFFRKAVAEIGGTKLEMSKGHFYFIGFFTASSGQVYYFSISDVRYFKEKRILIREAKGYDDYTGGRNCYLELDGKFAGRLKRFINAKCKRMVRTARAAQGRGIFLKRKPRRHVFN